MGQTPDSPTASARGEETGGDKLKEYRITLTPGPDILRRGINPLGVFDELRELGEVTISTDPELVPSLDPIDPEQCYLIWTIHIRTEAEPDRLNEVFLFFTEDSSVTIERRTSEGGWSRVRMDESAGLAPADQPGGTPSEWTPEARTPANRTVEPGRRGRRGPFAAACGADRDPGTGFGPGFAIALERLRSPRVRAAAERPHPG